MVQERNRLIVDTFKVEHGCSCGEDRLQCLDLHHRDPSLKLFSISQMLDKVGVEKLQTELEKCDVLCANCHRDLHHQERQAGR
jgi:hypothetical protein